MYYGPQMVVYMHNTDQDYYTDYDNVVLFEEDEDYYYIDRVDDVDYDVDEPSEGNTTNMVLSKDKWQVKTVEAQ